MKEKVASIFNMVVYMTAGGVMGYTAAKLMINSDNRFIPLLVLLAFVASMLVGIVIHEGGHLIFGLLTGYKFLSFRIGNLMLIKRDGKFSFTKFSIAGTAGQCLMSPPDLVDGKIPYFWYNLGGSLMNVISAALFGWVYIANQGNMTAKFMLFFIAVAVAMALTNGIPLKYQAVANDGYNIVALSKASAAQRAFWLQLKVNADMLKGVALEEMPNEWFRIPSDEEMNNVIIAVEGVFYCDYLFAKKQYDECEECIRMLTAKKTAINGIQKNLLTCELLICMVLRGADKSEIELLLTEDLKKFMKQMATYPTVIVTWYAYNRYVLGDEEKAKTNREEFKRVYVDFPYRKEADSDKELLDLIDSKVSGE